MTQVHFDRYGSGNAFWVSASVAAFLALAAAGAARASDISSAAPAFIERLPTATADAGFSGGHYLFNLSLPRPEPAGALHAPAGDSGTDLEAEGPALVPLAPPVWAGLAMLTLMAFVRTRQRRRYRRLRMGQLL